MSILFGQSSASQIFCTCESPKDLFKMQIPIFLFNKPEAGLGRCISKFPGEANVLVET